MIKKYWIVFLNAFIVICIIIYVGLCAGWWKHSISLSHVIAIVSVLVALVILDLVVMIIYTKRLQRTALEAEQANRSKSDFLSNMSHEIRTPITAILGMNEMIQRESNNTNVLEYSDNIQKAGVSLLGIISDILDFSKIEAGKMELVASEYSLEEIIGDLVNLTGLRASGKGLDLKVDVDPMLPKMLIGDEMCIKQIVTNLLSNAVKYTEKGTITLSFGLKDFSGKNIVMYVAVADTGIGIRQEEMDKLFSAFDRLDAVHTKSIEGTGLGLAITRKMLGMMGAELEVESTYGKGSKFFFYLKQDVPSWERIGRFETGIVETEDRKKKKSKASFAAPDVRILLVDDTPMNLQVIAGLLKRTMINVDVAVSGEECLEKFGENTYDLVFLDYRMPKMDGIQTLSALKKLYPDKIADTPVISLTASAISGDREMMLGAGFDDYLTKPVNIDDMEKMMIKHLPEGKVILEGTATMRTAKEMYPDADEETLIEIETLPDEIRSISVLNVEKGIDYCGEAEDYIAALDIYRRSIDSKSDTIKQQLKNKDYEAYTTTVHSLKSTSLAIGAVAISGMARDLEQCGKNNDIEKMESDTPKLLEMYKELKSLLDEYFEKGD